MSLVDAVEEKYLIMDDSDFPDFLISSGPSKNESGRLTIPPILILDDRGIDKAGEEENLRQMLQDVKELDLGKNQLSSWSEVVKLVKNCPAIVSVNLSKNPLGGDLNIPTADIEASNGRGFSSLRTLILNSTGVTWNQVFTLLPELPNLSELHLSMNNMDDVPIHKSNFPNIRTFHFNGNHLTSFKKVLQIGKIFPQVEQLFLIQNGLERIKEDPETVDGDSGDAEEMDFQLLPHLNHLNLSENCLTSWACVSCLRNLPSLSHLRIGSNPVFEGWSKENCRHHIIAWLPKLERLNGTPIDGIERKTAERAFIQDFVDDPEKPTRYFELEEKYERLDSNVRVDVIETVPKEYECITKRTFDNKSFMDALEEKYKSMYGLKFVGFRISCSPGINEAGLCGIPSILIMDDSCIDKAGDEETLREMLQDVQELDLGKNRLSSWSEVVKVVKNCPAIVSVNLSKNPLGGDLNIPTADIEAPIGNGFSNLQSLILNSTGVTWDQVFTLLPRLPNLNELHLSMNNMDDVPIHKSNFPNIRTFYFNGNRLTSFKKALQIGKIFPQVEQLFLIQNGLERIKEDPETVDGDSGDAEETGFHLLPHLNYLNLSENCVTNWACVSCLRNLPSLSHLRIGSNPVFEGWTKENGRFHVIAWLPNLERLNGSSIDGIEREKAERAFIRHFMNDHKKPLRYFELEEKHGRLDAYANVDLAPKRSVNVLVKYKDSTRVHDLSTEQTVGSVKKELCSLFGIAPSSITLLYVDQEIRQLDENKGTEALKLNNRGIHSYKPNDGDEFILNPK